MRYPRPLAALVPATLALAWMAFLPTHSTAQQIAGLVAEQGTLSAAPDAVITLYRVTGEHGDLDPIGNTVSAEDGSFIFIPAEPGTYRVQADFDGLLSPLSPPYRVGAEEGIDDLVLMVPSPLLMMAMSCNPEAAPGAVIVGFVRDGESGVGVPLGKVVARWIEGADMREIDTTADSRGRFLFCGIPAGGIVRFRGESFGKTGEWEEVEIPRPAFVFHDVHMTLGSERSFGQDVVAELVLGRVAGTMADLRGQLLDQLSGEPIQAAIVRVDGTGFQAVTDLEGRFAFTDLLPGAYTLQIQHLGYSVQSSEVTLEEGQDVSVRLRLSPRAVELDGIDIVARSQEEQTIRTSPFRRYVVSGESLADAEIRGATLPDVLRQGMIGLRVREINTMQGHLLCLETNRRIQRLTRTETVDVTQAEVELSDDNPNRRDPDEDENGCHMVQVIVDGLRISDSDGASASQYLQSLSVADVESMEYMPPMQGTTLYGIAGNVSNGVLVIYTRGKGPYRTGERDRERE